MSNPSEIPYLQEKLDLAEQTILALERKVADLRATLLILHESKAMNAWGHMIVSDALKKNFEGLGQ